MTKTDVTTVHGLLEHRARERPQDVFLYFEDQRFTFADIERSASRVACGLERLGVGPDDKVAIMMANQPDFLSAWFGLSKLGAVETPINTAHKGDVLAYMLHQADCVGAIVDAELLPPFLAAAAQAPKLKHVIVVGEIPPDAQPARTLTPLCDIMANDGAYTPRTVRADAPSAVMFTSGTTGPSKGVVLPQAYHLLQAEIICAKGGYGPQDRLYVALPLFHGNAQTLSTIPALMSGASMVLVRRFSASRFWDDIRRYGCTEFNYIGGILPILLKADPQPSDLDNPIRLMIGAGASGAVTAAFEARFGVTLLEAYGMSEIGSPLGSSAEVRRPGSCGQLNDLYEARLVDDVGEETPDGTPGELLLRPRRPMAMMLEYYGMPQQTVEAWRGLWFHTGDILKRDSDGFFYFVDRKKDALRRRGENISSFEVEQGVNSYPAVLESAAVAVMSELGEDEVMVCVVPKAGACIDPAELVAHCRARMAKFMTPRYVRVLDRLPKTPTERMQKFLLRAEGVTPDTFDSEAQAGALR